MVALRVLSVLVSVVLCVNAGFERRQFIPDIDVCELRSLNIGGGDSFHVTTSNYGAGNYKDNTDCCLTLNTGEIPLIVSFTFLHVEIESSQQCSYDYISFKDLRFCGSWARGRTFSYLVPDRAAFSIGFHTDFSVTLYGAKVLVEVRQAGDDVILEPGSGVGSASNKLFYQEATYNYEFAANYVDRCAAYRQVPFGNNSTYPPSNSNITYPSSSASYNNFTDYPTNYTRPPYTPTGYPSNYTRPPYTPTGYPSNYTRPPYTPTGYPSNYTRPPYTPTGYPTNYTRPPYTPTGYPSNYTRPPYTPTGYPSNYTRPPYTPTGYPTNYTRPPYTPTGYPTNYTSPSFNSTRYPRNVKRDESTEYPTNSTRHPYHRYSGYPTNYSRRPYYRHSGYPRKYTRPAYAPTDYPTTETSSP